MSVCLVCDRTCLKRTHMVSVLGFGGFRLMDLSKAFDTINHNLLIAKHRAYGISNDSLKLLYSYLSNRWHRTQINRKFSSWKELSQGVPQGSTFGPLLFNIKNCSFYLILLICVILQMTQSSMLAIWT